MDKNAVIARIKKASESKNILVAIDGMSASGKTSFAEELRSVFDCTVFHTDDFFIPLKERTNSSGNVDFERIKREVLPYLFSDVHYRKFHCSTQSFSDAFEAASPIVIFEGSYSMHPALGLFPDISVFMEIPKTEQLRRLAKREGENISAYMEKWLPMEAEYFSKHSVRKSCGIVIKG